MLPNVNTVEVGTGFTDEERKKFRVQLPKMIEVSFQGYTKSGSLRHPRFERERWDKV